MTLLKVSFIATIVLMVVFAFVGPHDMRITKLQMAGSWKNAKPIVDHYKQTEWWRARTNQTLDYFFIPCYATLLALLSFQFAARLPYPWLSIIGWGMVVAALCDYAENICIELMFQAKATGTAPELARIFATTKYALIVIALVWVAVGSLFFRQDRL